MKGKRRFMGRPWGVLRIARPSIAVNLESGVWVSAPHARQLAGELKVTGCDAMTGQLSHLPDP